MACLRGPLSLQSGKDARGKHFTRLHTSDLPCHGLHPRRGQQLDRLRSHHRRLCLQVDGGPLLAWKVAIFQTMTVRSIKVLRSSRQLSYSSNGIFFRYLYADLYGVAIWAGAEVPVNSGNYTSTRMDFDCSENSPIPCDRVAGSPLPDLGYVFSFGEDNRKDVFLLSSGGVYRIVPPSQCNYTCPLENTTDAGGSGSSSSASQMEVLRGRLVAAAAAAAVFVLLWWC